MVGQKNKLYLLTGGSSLQRKGTLAKIKKNIFTKEGSAFSFLTFYARGLDLKYFQNAVLTFSFQRKKIILIKDFTGLTKPVKQFLFDNLPKISFFNYLIFESETPFSHLKKNKKINSDNFFKAVFAKSVKYQGKAGLVQTSINDFSRSLYQNNFKGCLFIAEELLSHKGPSKGTATQILGILINKFSYLNNVKEKEKIFKRLWETDRALKETNLDQRLLVERLLASLIK